MCELSAPCSSAFPHALVHADPETCFRYICCGLISVHAIYPGPVLAVGKGRLSYTAVRVFIQLDIGVIAMGQISYAESSLDGSAV